MLLNYKQYGGPCAVGMFAMCCNYVVCVDIILMASNLESHDCGPFRTSCTVYVAGVNLILKVRHVETCR